MAKKRTANSGDGKYGRSGARGATAGPLSDEERAAVREHIQEMKSAARRNKLNDRKENEAAVLAKIAEMPDSERAMAARLHHLISAAAPDLSPKLWYGMPAYTNGDGAVICFFQNAQKFKTRYCTLGFSDKAHLDDGPMWPTAFALREFNVATEAKIAALVKKAVD